MEKQKHTWSKWIAAFVFAVAVITVYKTFDNITDIFSAIGSFLSLITPFIIGGALAFFLYPACRKLEESLSRCKYSKIAAVKKGLSVLIVYAAFILVLALGISLLMPRLSASIAEFVKRLPDYMAQIHDYLRSLTQSNTLFKLFDAEEIIRLLSFENLYSILFRGDWGLYINGVIGVTSTLLSWIMGIIICAYTLLERDSLFRMSRKLAGIFIKEDTINKIGFYIHEISSIFYNFFFGKAIDSLIIGIIAIIGFSILGLPYSLLMGIITMLFNMIPYFGPIIGAVPVVLITLLVKDVYSAIWAAVFIVFLQQLDGNVIGPKILGDSVGVSPFWVIFAIVVFGGFFGVPGMIFGVPLIAAIRMLLLDYLDDGKLNGTKPQSENGSSNNIRKGLFAKNTKADKEEN